jgi:hypothetical protein
MNTIHLDDLYFIYIFVFNGVILVNCLQMSFQQAMSWVLSPVSYYNCFKAWVWC